MRASGGDGSSGGNIADSGAVSGENGEKKNGGGVVGKAEEGSEKTPANTELWKKSSCCGGPIFRKKNGRSVRIMAFIVSSSSLLSADCCVVVDSGWKA